MDSGNTNAVRGLANIYRQQSPEKAEAFIASLSASQRRSIDDIERSLQNDRLAQQAEALENQGKWTQAAALQRQRLALDPGSVWITYRLSQDLWQAGQRSQADTLMRNLAQQKPNDPEQVYAYGLYLSGHDQDRAALAHINSLPPQAVQTAAACSESTRSACRSCFLNAFEMAVLFLTLPFRYPCSSKTEISPIGTSVPSAIISSPSNSAIFFTTPVTVQ